MLFGFLISNRIAFKLFLFVLKFAFTKFAYFMLYLLIISLNKTHKLQIFNKTILYKELIFFFVNKNKNFIKNKNL